MADVLPGYTYNRESARYRNSETGRFVARRDIISLLEAQTNGAENRLGELVTALHEKRIDASTWQSVMRDELRRLHSQNAALGAGGWDRMDFRAWGRVGGYLAGDYTRLTNLAQDIADGKVSLPQALNRVDGYVISARRNFFEADRDAMFRSGRAFEERRRLGSSEHCAGCVDYAAMGYQPLGVLPIPGDGSTECKSWCKCIIERREVTA
jgi:hypothetical protein